MKQDDVIKAMAIFMAINHTTRFKIIEELGKKDLRTTRLAKVIKLPQSKIDYHLKELAKVEIIIPYEAEGDRRGTYWSLNDAVIQKVNKALDILCA